MSGTDASKDPALDAAQQQSERRRLLAAIEAGLADAQAGRVRSHEAVVAQMRERFGGR